MEGMSGFGLGFTFGRHHSSEFGITRTSNGNRYQRDLPQSKDVTQEVIGSHGLAYLGSSYQKKEFTLSFAFEEMTEEQWNSFVEWLGDNKIHDLIFDEEPHKIWSAKVTGKAQQKYLAFDKKYNFANNEVIYRGEGTIQFTCYYPFARSKFNTREEYELASPNTLAYMEFINSNASSYVLSAEEEQMLRDIFGQDAIITKTEIEDEGAANALAISDLTLIRGNEPGDISIKFLDDFPNSSEVGWKNKNSFKINNIGNLPLYPMILKTIGKEYKTYSIYCDNSDKKITIDESLFGFTSIAEAKQYEYIINTRTCLITLFPKPEYTGLPKRLGNRAIIEGDFFTIPLGEHVLNFRQGTQEIGNENEFYIFYNYLYLT